MTEKMRELLQLYSTPVSARENLLVMFKHHSRWNAHTLYTLSRAYNVYFGDYKQIFQRFNTKQIQGMLAEIQKEFKFVALLVDIEWGPYFSIASVELFEEILPVGLILLDDGTMHDYNQVLASRASFVLTACPIGHYKYLEADIPSANVYLATSRGGYGNEAKVESGSPKAATLKNYDFDLLWFGFADKADRRQYIDAILKQFPALRFHVHQGKQHGEIAMSGDLSWPELGRLIERAGCCLNLTQSDFPVRTRWDNMLPRPLQRVSTVRPIECGLLGTWCISEYSPGYVIWGLEGLMPMFKNTSECECLIEEFLVCAKDVVERRRAFVDHVRERFSDEHSAVLIKKVVCEARNRKTRMISRVSPYYSQHIVAQFNSWFQNHPDRLALEISLLEQAINRTTWDFRRANTPEGTFFEPVVRVDQAS